MNDYYEHWSGLLTAKDVGLGWLKTITTLRTQRAMAMHRHAHSTAEIIFCLKGEFHYRISGFGKVAIGAGDGIVIPARTEHGLDRNIEIPGERISLFLHRRMRRDRKFAVFSPSDYRRFRERLDRSAGRAFGMPTALMANVRRLAEIAGREPGTIRPEEFALVRILACSILYDVVEVLDRPQPRARPEAIQKAIRYLEEHHAEKLRVGDLIRYVGYGRARFFDLFREHTHLTPIEYLTRYRLAKANELLTASALPIAKVAAAVGIDDPVYFAALFRRNMGVSPRTARQTAAAQGHAAGTP